MNPSSNYPSLNDILAGIASAPNIGSYINQIETHIRRNLTPQEAALYSLLPLPLYSQWRIGITDDLKTRLAQHISDGHRISDPYAIQVTLREAQAIESHFIRLHMQGGVGGQAKGPNTFVYIFK